MIRTEAEVATVGKEFYSPMLRALEKAAGAISSENKARYPKFSYQRQ